MKIIAAQFANWQAALEDFQKSVEKDLEEIRRCKREVRRMKMRPFAPEDGPLPGCAITGTLMDTICI